MRLLAAVNQPGWGTFQCQPPIAALQWGSGAAQNNAGKPRSGQGRRHAALVSPLGTAQSPKRNLQLSCSPQPTAEGGPFSTGRGRCRGSATGAAALSAASPLCGSRPLVQRALLIPTERSACGKGAERRLTQAAAPAGQGPRASWVLGEYCHIGW